jgi:predicted NBD/HSP70 family sugar kinase
MTLPIPSDVVVGIDLGGSNVRLSLTDLAGEQLASGGAATEQAGPDALVEQLVGLAQQLAASADVSWARVAAAGVGVAGAVHRDGSNLRLAPNLPVDPGFAGVLGERLGVPVVFDNDVNVATLAEQRYGLGAGVDDFVFIAVGTGIGMGIVASGALVRGATGAAGEIGFLPLGLAPFDPASQVAGSLEEVAGGAGVARRYGEPDTSAREIFRRRAAGDAHAAAVLEAQARATALAVVSAVAMLDPALVILGGGIGGRADFLADVRRHVAALTLHAPALAASRLGERAGLIGAAELARAHVAALAAVGGAPDA